MGMYKTAYMLSSYPGAGFSPGNNMGIGIQAFISGLPFPLSDPFH